MSGKEVKRERKSEVFHTCYKALFKLIIKGKRVSEKDRRFSYSFTDSYLLDKLGRVLLKH